jgi:hypothetical protein
MKSIGVMVEPSTRRLCSASTHKYLDHKYFDRKYLDRNWDSKIKGGLLIHCTSTPSDLRCDTGPILRGLIPIQLEFDPKSNNLEFHGIRIIIYNNWN